MLESFDFDLLLGTNWNAFLNTLCESYCIKEHLHFLVWKSLFANGMTLNREVYFGVFISYFIIYPTISFSS